MNEWLMIASMTVGGAGFSIGGTGPKWVRRYVLPTLLGLICFFAGLPGWRAGVFAILLCVSLHLGYGEKVPYWRKCIVFGCYGLATLPLGFSWWQMLLPLFCLALFFLSNWKPSGSTFVWKICEFLMGTFIGATVAKLLPA